MKYIYFFINENKGLVILSVKENRFNALFVFCNKHFLYSFATRTNNAVINDFESNESAKHLSVTKRIAHTCQQILDKRIQIPIHTPYHQCSLRCIY